MTCLAQPSPAPPWLRGDPSAWSAGTLDRAGLQAEAQRLTQSTGFMSLARAVAREVLRFLDGSPAALRVVRDMPMYLLLVCCMHLHHRRDPGQSHSGITLTQLRTLYTRGGTRRYASDTHLRDMLAWARQRGLLRLAATSDARQRRLEPTALMVDMFRHWLGAFASAGAVTPPLPGWPAGQAPCAALAYEVLSYRICAYWIDGFVPTERFAQIQALMQRRHGYHLFLMLLAGLPDAAADGATLPLSLTTVATRFQIARGTVRNSLALMQDAGLLQYDGLAETVCLQPGFHTLAQDWMAQEITWMAGLCHAASARLAAQDQPPPTA